MKHQKTSKRGCSSGKGKLRLCPYHSDSLGWDACSEGFVGCQVVKAKAHFMDSGDCRRGRHVVDVGHGDSVVMCGECFSKYMAGPDAEKPAKRSSKKLWAPLSGIPGVSDRTVACDNDREVKAETGRR